MTKAAGVGSVIELDIAALAAGGDGVARDASGRVTFVPRVAPGDRIRARIVHRTSSLARGELVEVIAPSSARVEPPCPAFARGCGGCAWQHVARAEQLAAKQAIVAGALRKLGGLRVHPIADPGPPLGWRRRARFHVEGGRAGLYERGRGGAGGGGVSDADRGGGGGADRRGAASSADRPGGSGAADRETLRRGAATRGLRVLPLAHCPQLAPALDAAYAVVAASTPPDGELALLLAHDGRVAVATERAWRGAGALVGRAGIVGVLAGDVAHGEVVLEIEPGLWGGPWDFAQASHPGNAALIAQARAALGPGPGRLLELYAGAGNLTRGFVADGWDVVATDIAMPARPPAAFHAGSVEDVLARLPGPWDAVALDPPRTGAAEAIDGILRAAPRVVLYVSCDVATLARDAARLTDGGAYRATDAWPLDVMPQTAHVEVVMRLQRG
jgi:23S rRNA (uracil1939-C5)-methyltransferase